MSFRVLIVDDAGFIRSILGSLLADLGCHVIGEARTGEEAIQRAQSLKPDVIFMDMVLPGKNGAEATQEILDAMPTCRVIAMSTADQDVVRLRAEAAGAIRFLEKPFNRSGLLETLQSLDGYRTVRQPLRAEGE